MDLSGWLLRRTRPHAFVVTGLGGTGARLGVERVLRERGWAQALSPAAANLLVLCGPEQHELRRATDAIWSQLPRPRARLHLAEAERIEAALDEAVEKLAQPETGRAGRLAADDVPMADRAPDRDGLKLDQLHLPLGPALPDWPAGLVLRLSVQGDVVQEAETEIVGTAVGSFWTEPSPHRQAAAALDSIQRLLRVAGWPAAAGTARWLRDDLLAGVSADRLAPVWTGWDRRVRRSRPLRWSTDGVGQGHGGDASTRWMRWLDVTAAAMTGASVPPAARADTAVVAAVAELVRGQELAAVRLIVASLDPDLEAVAAEATAGRDG